MTDVITLFLFQEHNSKNNDQNEMKRTTTRTKIMAVLNVTPDSFSDGGQFNTVDTALARARSLIADGADILDIGGESTRPFATPVELQEELRRIIPPIEAIHSEHPATPISIDTMKAEVARQALAAGATFINDISACRADKEMVNVVVKNNAPLIIMHMQGTPQDMQVNPQYDDVVEELLRFFRERLASLTSAGVRREKIILDPGIGFGKRLEHNLSLIHHLNRFAELHQPLLLAHSRKSFLGSVTGIKEKSQRDFATATVAALACAPWVDMVRVHNVALTREALLVAEAIASAA